MISENLSEFNGKRVIDFNASVRSLNPGVCYRVRLDWETYEKGVTVQSCLDALLDLEHAAELEELVIGAWDCESSSDTGSLVDYLVCQKEKLPALKALMFGDITSEEQEISWIQQSDVGPLLQAFPTLETLVVRGGQGLRLNDVSHDRLQSLTLQSGGLPAEVLRDIAAARLPALKHLELWLGEEGYGGDSTIDDVRQVVVAHQGLHFLGLMDSQMTDEIAKALLDMPLPPQLIVLDLSMGTLGDEGAEALLANPAMEKLATINLRHHYMSEEMMKRLVASGLLVEMSDQQSEDTYGDESWRYIEVAE